VISHADAATYSERALTGLLANGILGGRFKARRIPRPSRYGSGDDLLVRETPLGLLGVAEDDAFIQPLPLEDNDRWLYEISPSHLVALIRSENGIAGSEFENHRGLISVGTKMLSPGVPARVYLSLPNANEQTVLGRCARLSVPNPQDGTFLLLPGSIAFSPEASRILHQSRVEVLSLMESAAYGHVTLNWAVTFRGGTGVIPESVRAIRKSGSIWTLIFDGMTVSMSKSIGLVYIDYLLHAPGKEFHVAQLAKAAEGNFETVALGSAGEMLDETALRGYKERIASLRSEIAQAISDNNTVRKETLEIELDRAARVNNFETPGMGIY